MPHITTEYHLDALAADPDEEHLRHLVDHALSDTEWEVSGLALDDETVLCALAVNLESFRNYLLKYRRPRPTMDDLIIYKGGHHVALTRATGERLVMFTIAG